MDREKYERLAAPRQGLPEVVYTEPQIQRTAAVVEEAGNGQAELAATIEGRAQLFGDNIDTDAMIAGEFCHLNDLKELGEKAFYHFRPEFPERVRNGENIIVAGEGWGCGSSREHAAWALKGAGVKAIVAKSFAYIHKRNLVNEAIPFIIMRDERFYERVKDGDPLVIDLQKGTVTLHGETYQGEPLPGIMRRIMANGGIVPHVKKRLAAAAQDTVAR